MALIFSSNEQVLNSFKERDRQPGVTDPRSAGTGEAKNRGHSVGVKHRPTL